MYSPAFLLVVASLCIIFDSTSSFSLHPCVRNTLIRSSIIDRETTMSTETTVSNNMAASDDQPLDGASSTTPILVHTSPFLRPTTTAPENIHRALVILNSPIRTPPSPLFQELWDTSTVRVCADGGANRLYKANPELIPNLIRGDLDSVHPHVQSYYESKGVSIERDPCQNSNDLDKALSSLLQDTTTSTGESQSTFYTRVIVYGAFGGRFDQEMGCIQALYKWSARFQYRMVLFDDITSAFLMPAGVRNEIRIPHYGEKEQPSSSNNNAQQQQILGEGPTCGLIPVGSKCDTVVTTGFKWDLDGTIPLEFGGLVSTSNHVAEEVVTVEASHPLIFTAEVTCGVADVF